MKTLKQLFSMALLTVGALAILLCGALYKVSQTSEWLSQAQASRYKSSLLAESFVKVRMT